MVHAWLLGVALAEPPEPATDSAPSEAAPAEVPVETAATKPLAEAWGLAETLVRSGYPEAGAVEVIRALEAHPDDPDAARTRLRLSRLQRRTGQPVRERRTLSIGLERHPELAPWFGLALADACAIQREWSCVLEASHPADLDGTEVADPGHYYYAWGLVGTGRIGEAQAALGQVAGPLKPRAEGFGSDLDRWGDLPRRSPLAAAGLGIVPGLGHMYAGAPLTGVGVLVIDGGLAAGAAWMLTHDEPLLGAALGALFVTTWASSLADAAGAAVRFNRRREREREERYWTRWGVSSELGGQGQPPLDVRPSAPAWE